MEHVKQVVVLAGVYVAIGFAVSSALKRSLSNNSSSADASDDTGVTSYRLDSATSKDTEENTQKKKKKQRRGSLPLPPRRPAAASDSAYLSAHDVDSDEEEEGSDVDEGTTDFEAQLERIWAGPLPRPLEEILDILRYPEIFASFGSRMPKGVILSGPPGTGKTWFAKCLAQLTHASFFYASASQFDEIYVGRGPQRIRALFAEAAAANKARAAAAAQRAAAASPHGGISTAPWWRRVLFGTGAQGDARDGAQKPQQEEEEEGGCMSIIFIDELDALGQRGGLMNGDARHATLSELLTQMDGMASATSGTILVVAATNNLNLIDPALLRSGRFDRIVSMPLPELAAREAMLWHYVGNKPLSASFDHAAVIRAIAHATAGFNCADLKNMINECTIAATRAAVARRKQADRTRRRRAPPSTPETDPLVHIDIAHLLVAFEAMDAKIRKERPQNELLPRREIAALLGPLHALATPVEELPD